MKSITVLGWIGKGNIGDEAFRLAFPKIFPNYKFDFTDKIKKEHVDNSDAFILGGGDVLADVFIDQLLPIKKPKYAISVSASAGIDASKMAKFDGVYVRESKSVEIMAQKGLKCNYTPDIAFSLEANRKHGKRIIQRQFKKQKRDLYEKVVVVVLNGFLCDAEANSYDVRKFINFHKLAYDLGHMMDYTPASFVFVPFGQQPPWDDRVANAWTMQKCKFWKKNLFIWSEPSVQNVLDMIGAADAVISTRLHSTIFSIAAGTPFLDITHNHKNTWLLDTVNMKHRSVSYESFDEEVARKLLTSMLFDQETHVKEMKALIDNQRTLLKGLSNVHLC